MTYNELGLVKNDYDGGYGYGDTVSIIDMNDEGVAMLEDNLFTSKAFAEANPNTVKAFVSASMKGLGLRLRAPGRGCGDRIRGRFLRIRRPSGVYGFRGR